MVGGTISLTTNFCSDIPLDSFVVGKIKPAFMQKLTHRAIKPFAYRIVFIISFYGDLAGTFNVLTYMAATSYVADIFSTMSKSMIWGYGLHSTCRWCLLGLHSR